MLANRFPGVRDGWSRFDGPAGTQMVDTAIAAMSDWASGGLNANSGGFFPAAQACDELIDSTRQVVGELLGADWQGISFGANMTTMTFALARAIAQTLRPGDKIVGTRLDHEANISPWRIACELSGAEHILAPFDPKTGRLNSQAVIDLVDQRTKWVTIAGASNLIGTMPDLAPIISHAKNCGAKVFVDAVALVPHQPVNIAQLGCDVFVTSAYKWYGPHAGVMYVDPKLLTELPIAKVRPASNSGARKFETGTSNYESIAAIGAAAQFLIDTTMAKICQYETQIFAPLLNGLLETSGVTVWGPKDLVARTPTVCFTVDSMTTDEVAQHLADKRIAVWSGHSYAVEVVEQLGLTQSGGVVRAGISTYLDESDVSHLLATVRELISR